MNDSTRITVAAASRILRRALRLLIAVTALLAAFGRPSASRALAEGQEFPSAALTSEVIRLINLERAKAGAPPLVEDTDLLLAADLRAREAAHMFSHTRPDGRKWNTIFYQFQIKSAFRGENLARGQRTAKAVVGAWMNSKSHRDNILNASFNRAGVGFCIQNGVPYWSQLFMQIPPDR